MPEERMGLPPALVCRGSAMNKIHYNRIILIQYTFYLYRILQGAGLCFENQA